MALSEILADSVKEVLVLRETVEAVLSRVQCLEKRLCEATRSADPPPDTPPRSMVPDPTGERVEEDTASTLTPRQTTDAAGMPPTPQRTPGSSDPPANPTPPEKPAAAAAVAAPAGHSQDKPRCKECIKRKWKKPNYALPNSEYCLKHKPNDPNFALSPIINDTRRAEPAIIGDNTPADVKRRAGKSTLDDLEYKITEFNKQHVAGVSNSTSDKPPLKGSWLALWGHLTGKDHNVQRCCAKNCSNNAVCGAHLYRIEKDGICDMKYCYIAPACAKHNEPRFAYAFRKGFFTRTATSTTVLQILPHVCYEYIDS